MPIVILNMLISSSRFNASSYYSIEGFSLKRAGGITDAFSGLINVENRQMLLILWSLECSLPFKSVWNVLQTIYISSRCRSV